MLVMWRGHYYSWGEFLFLMAILVVVVTIWIMRDHRRKRDEDNR